MTTVILRKARKSIMYFYILLFVTLQGCNVARFMSDDQQCTFDGEHGNIREHIDIDKLNAELKEIVARENELRAQIDELIANI